MRFLILSAGHDSVVLKRRNAVITAAGYSVASATDSHEAVDKLLNGDFDLVVLCQSIPDDDRRRLARIISSYSPSTPIIMVSQGQRDDYEFGTLALRCRPDQVVAAIQDCLAEAPNSPRHMRAGRLAGRSAHAA